MFVVLLFIVPGFGALPNDSCRGALVIPNGPFPVLTSVVDASLANPNVTLQCGCTVPGRCDFRGSNCLFYFFTPSITQTYTISTCNTSSTADTVLALLATEVGNLCSNVLQCDDDSCGGLWSRRSRISQNLQANYTYAIEVCLRSGAVSTLPPVGNSSVQIRIEVGLGMITQTTAQTTSTTTSGSGTASTTAPASTTGYCQVYNDPWVRDFNSGISRHCDVPAGTILFTDGVTTITGEQGRWWSDVQFSALKNVTITRTGYTSTFAAGTGQRLSTVGLPTGISATAFSFTDSANLLSITIHEMGIGANSWLNVYIRGKKAGSGLCVSNSGCRAATVRAKQVGNLVSRADAICDAITDADVKATCNLDAIVTGGSTFSAAAREVAADWLNAASSASSSVWNSSVILAVVFIFFVLF
jgi:hypothetical protein